MEPSPVESEEERAALVAAATGDDAPMGGLLESYRQRLQRMLHMRLDPRLHGRVGVSDVVQEAYVEVAERLPKYLGQRASEDQEAMPFFLWVRFIAGQKLQQLHRQHLGTRARDAGREVPMRTHAFPEASSILLASALVASGVSPSQAVDQNERRELLVEALEGLAAQDREVLMLRHFEQLSNREIANLLGLSAAGASLRHLRALGRLQEALARLGLSFSPSDVGPKRD